MTLTLYCVKVVHPGGCSQFIYIFPIDKSLSICYTIITKNKGDKKMEIKINDGFVVLPLEEYLRLKEIEKDAHEMWEEKIRNILKGDKK